MRLKQIKIVGFKSFADKVTVDFHRGMTGIVGPNGCGKSNISDAFCWVLGGTAKSLRAKKTEDIIFSGTLSRKPLNFAEVTITLTDIDGTLPVDYDEVEITRRYHRSGESEFFLNRQSVRMKDIQNLLLDSGIGKSAFSIFEQGKIDQVIQYSPLERRSIFEEAAGILRFLQRKKEALRKLEQADSNISRVKDIHREVEKQIVVLEQQAEEARIYKEKKIHYETMEKKLFLSKWYFFEDKNQEIRALLEQKKDLICSGHESVEAMDCELKEAKLHLAEGDLLLRDRNEEVYQARSAREIKVREKQSNLERIRENASKEVQWRQELENIALKKAQRKSELERSFSLLNTLQQEKDLSEEEFQSMRDLTESEEKEVCFLRQKQQQAQAVCLQSLKNESELESNLKQEHLRLENTQEKIALLTRQKSEIEVKIETLTPLVQEKKIMLSTLSQSIDAAKIELRDLDEVQGHVCEEIDLAQKEFEKVSRNYTDAETRFNVLKRMHDENEGFSPASKKLLKQSADKKSPFFGKLKGLYEYIQPIKPYENAASSILRSYAQTLAVETQEDFYSILEYAKQEKLEDFSLICLETIVSTYDRQHNETHEGITSFLKDVKANKITHHFFHHVYASADIKSAQLFQTHQKNCSLWIEDGGVLDVNHVLVYTSQKENNVFVREVELKALSEKMVALKQQKQELDKKMSDFQEKKALIQSKRIEVDKRIRREEMSLIEVNFALQRATGDMERYCKEREQIVGDLEVTNTTLQEYSTRIEDIKNKLSLAKEIAKSAEREAENLTSTLHQKELKLQERKAFLAEKEKIYRNTSDHFKKIEHQIRVLQVQEEENEEQMQRMQSELESSSELKTFFEQKNSAFEKDLFEVEERLACVVESCSQLERDVNERRKAIEKVEWKMKNQAETIRKLETDENKLNIQSAQAKAALEAICNELLDRYQLSMEELKNTSLEMDKTLDELEKCVKSLRKDLELTQSTVNMTSIEEFERHKERYEFLNHEIEDMSHSKEELLAIITKLDQESKKIFKDTFEKIKFNFQKNFKILFNGGEADLQFTEDGNILEVGIEIIAKPPGKQMRSINLLSGGEKCMTAVALLFAIFEVKPAPFCILDEIDAPLDDSNVERFVNVVKQFEQCQFIVVTHNKRTMEACDRLYGVSMQERGVSKLLSMEFKEQQRVPVLV